MAAAWAGTPKIRGPSDPVRMALLTVWFVVHYNVNPFCDHRSMGFQEPTNYVVNCADVPSALHSLSGVQVAFLV